MRWLLLVGVAACGTTTGEKIDAGPPGRLTINLTGTAIGYVDSDPPGIACGTTCSAMFPAGTEVTLFPTVGHDGSFGGWGDACFGSRNCTFTIDGDQTVTAAFPCTGKKVFDYVGGLHPIQTFSAPACAAHVIIEASGAQGGNFGGLGAQIQGRFAISAPASHDLTVLVGAYGGGASFVYSSVTDAVPLVAAAGGGASVAGCSGGPGSATQTPTTSIGGPGNAAGGSAGAGGSGGSNKGGGGGAGWLSDGHPGVGASSGGGSAPRNGGTGGGGVSGGSGFNGGGGGNIVGNTIGCGGGGGSYNGGDNQTNLEGVWPASGRVTITWTE